MQASPPTVPRPPGQCFAFLCWDGPDAQGLRDRDLDAHLAHVEMHWRDLLVAGPLKEPGTDRFVGSLFLVIAPDADAAWEICRGDPYFSNGQYERIEVKHFTRSIGQAVGGKIWEDAAAIRARTGAAST